MLDADWPDARDEIAGDCSYSPMAFNRLTAFEGDLYQFLLGLRPFLSLDILSVTFDCVITTFNHNISIYYRCHIGQKDRKYMG